MAETTKAAKPNQRKAVEAWASWQRLEVLGEPLVMELLWVYDCLFVRSCSYSMKYVKTYAVAAAVNTEVGRHGNGAAEVEDGVQGIKTDDEQRVDHERLLDACRDKVEQRQHAEH